jgi:molybdopterin molybdotransferase
MGSKHALSVKQSARVPGATKSGLLKASAALQLILSQCRRGCIVQRSLAKAAGAFLAKSIHAPQPSPPFNQSHVDGYGVTLRDVRYTREETPASLSVVSTIRAGDVCPRRLAAGEAVKIFTGAPVPAGVQAIVMREHCREEQGRVLVYCSAKSGDHIRYCGEEFQKNAVVLRPGERLTPPALGLLASLGYRDVWVYESPRVGLLTTGNELIKPGRGLHRGQVYECNSIALAAALRGVGIRRIQTAHARDDTRHLRGLLSAMLSKNDIVISVGGVSVGDYDLVRTTAEEAGVRQIFWRVAVKPGMPLYFGVFSNKAGQSRMANSHRRSALFIGLPGNPVSALVTFHQFVRPALLRMLGQKTPSRFLIPVRIACDLRKKHHRLEWVRSRIEAGREEILAKPVSGQQSHMLAGLAEANSLVEFPARLCHASRNDHLMAEWLDWM